MLNNNQNTSIKFSSVSGLLIKTHPNSRMSWCDVSSSFYEKLDDHLILQVAFLSESRVFVEYLENYKDLGDIFTVKEKED